jgi:hypothetical protein
MSNEELLKPRYKVIADYPSSDFNIGDIVYADPFGRFMQYGDYGAWQLHPEIYPAIFRKLEWWEERSPEDMPEYVKEGKVVHKVTYSKSNNLDMWMRFEHGGKWLVHKVVMCFYEPATKEEYETFLHNKVK